ncbi:MAG: UDP-3-O-(3-hydroxymyristoyl)glucosamine N-acyltransferase [Gammaproteobacteria bacterium]|nr:UDP-3-O-(3-hydroxymyristoyl)glucosamine N-acyltransferase [Gammaproteobacteria bacterium]
MAKQQKTLGELAAYLKIDLRGDPECVITGVGTLQSAKVGELSFLTNPLYRHFLPETAASAVILTAKDVDYCPTNALVTDNPHFVYAKLATIFDKKPRPRSGIHPTAVIGENCQIDDSATISARAVVGDNTQIGANTVIGPGVVIGQSCHLGDECLVEANVTIEFDSHIHNRVIIHSGAVIGSDGFGMAEDAGVWYRVPQLGRVVIEDDVEIGANTTIDRGALDNTVIECGVKLDNQIQIAHNVRVGAHTVIAGCTGIAGSAKIGKHCKIGGAVTIAGHVNIVDHTMLTGTTAVSNSIKEPGVYSSGFSCMPHGEWRRNIGRLRRLDKIIKKWTSESKQTQKGESRCATTDKPRAAFKAERVAVMTDQYMPINEMMECLPQRAPFLLIDRVIEFIPEKRCLKAIKNITMNEAYFQGHFPDYPIMPGVLILEALGQAGTVLANLVMGKKDQPNVCYLAGIDNARFKRPVEPGDQLLLSVECTRARRGVLKMQGIATVGTETVCTANILSVSKAEERSKS